MTPPAKTTFVPAAGVHWLTRFYDPALALLMRERVWKRDLLEQVAPRPGERILDLGCGTGTLALILQQACPDATIIGLDVDPEVLAIAERKAAQAGARITFVQGRVDVPPTSPVLERESFDKMVSSLVFHHLGREQKRRALAQTAGLMRPGEEMHVADWGRPQNALMRLLFYPVQLLDGFANTSDHVKGRLPDLMGEAGFADVRETRRWATVFGTLSFYKGVKP